MPPPRGRLRDLKKEVDEGERFAWKVCRRLCLITAAIQLARLILSPGWTADRPEGYLAAHPDEAYLMEHSKEWFEGPSMCTYRGTHHLAWSFPLKLPTYFLGGSGMHFFAMFAPCAAIDPKLFLEASLPLILTGPLAASYISGNLHEQPAIWCFFSMMQVVVGVSKTLWEVRSIKESKPGFQAQIDDSAL